MFKSLYCPTKTPDATIFKRLATPNGTLPPNGTVFYQDRETLPQDHRDSTKIVGGYLRPQIAQRLALGIGEGRARFPCRITAERAPTYVQNPPIGLPGHLGHCHGPPPQMKPLSDTRCGLVRELDSIAKPVMPAFGPAGNSRLDASQGNASPQMDMKRPAIPRHQRLVNQSKKAAHRLRASMPELRRDKRGKYQRRRSGVPEAHWGLGTCVFPGTNFRRIPHGPSAGPLHPLPIQSGGPMAHMDSQRDPRLHRPHQRRDNFHATASLHTGNHDIQHTHTQPIRNHGYPPPSGYNRSLSSMRQ